MRDLRDPSAVGDVLLGTLAAARGAYSPKITASEAWDVHVGHLDFPDHNANPTTIEKYGRPQDLPPTV